ncbi:MAG TPA: DUF2889 domain-containing protein [Syntrophales bacterium]|nr:DUF2889 domain-containing protein [Syntrophales bacterium]
MNLFGKQKGKKYHTRDIEINTYEYDDARIAVEGSLTDHRSQEYYLATGERRQPGILHQMIIHLLVNKTSLVIEDLHVAMPAVPREDCLETMKSLDPIKGQRITHGFTARVKGLVGKGRGCNHLVELLTVMGASAIQGYVAYRLQEPARFKPDLLDMVADTCWTWRAEGHLVKDIEARIKAERKGETT